MCAQRKAGRRERERRASPAICTLPMVPCGSSPVTRVSRSPLPCKKRSAWGGGWEDYMWESNMQNWEFVTSSLKGLFFWKGWRQKTNPCLPTNKAKTMEVIPTLTTRRYFQTVKNWFLKTNLWKKRPKRFAGTVHSACLISTQPRRWRLERPVKKRWSSLSLLSMILLNQVGHVECFTITDLPFHDFFKFWHKSVA